MVLTTNYVSDTNRTTELLYWRIQALFFSIFAIRFEVDDSTSRSPLNNPVIPTSFPRGVRRSSEPCLTVRDDADEGAGEGGGFGGVARLKALRDEEGFEVEGDVAGCDGVIVDERVRRSEDRGAFDREEAIEFRAC